GANREPSATISLLSFAIPGLSFEALNAASVAGDKTAEELAAQAALQAQLDLLESDKDKNSDTIKGQSNSYNSQAPSLFDLDEDILARIIADTEYELSPEYIFDKVDPDKTLDTEPKFFLDPYQEAQAVTQAALQQTGSAFFSPDWNTSAEQRQGLYDNTLVYLEQQQGITLGKALTPMQVKQLEQPMIWYVSMNIAGQSQLVPTVYLPEATLDQITTPSAGTIIADSIDINVGDFKNTGDIQVANSARIQADVITNQRNVMTFGDDSNYGAIAGTGGNISAGNLALISQTDINNNGGSLTTKDSLTLNTQGDINLNALELKNRSQHGKNITESTDYLLSQINVGGDATFQAGGDINSQAAQAKIGGNGIFDATNINLLGVTERDYSKTVSKKKGLTSSSKKTIEQEKLNFIGSDFQVGGNMLMNAKNDITMVGANVDVGKSAAIKAGNDITVTAGISTDTYSKNKSGSGIATTSSQQKGHIKETATGSMIKTGESLQIDSDGGNVAILASELDAKKNLVFGDMTVKVDENGNKMVDENGQYITEDGSSINNLTIGTVALKDEDWNVKSSGLKGPLKDLAGAAAFALSATALGQVAMAAGLDTEIEVGKTSESRVESTTHVTSTISAGDTLVVRADGDFRIEGSQVNATDASIETNSTVITAVENTTTTTESSSTHTVGATKATLKKDEVTVAGSSETKQSETTTTTDSELVKAGLNVSGNLAMNSVENIDVLASDVNVDGNSTAKAKTIPVAGLAETTTTEHKEKTETTTTSIGVKNAYVDTAYAVQAVADAGAAVDAAKSALEQAKRDVKNGTLQANAIADYEANLAAATTQLTQATLSLAASAATAAGTTSCTAGVTASYGSGGLQRRKALKKVWLLPCLMVLKYKTARLRESKRNLGSVQWFKWTKHSRFGKSA
ncbi:MAG: hemagglutinin repeat-containing protein, partial [Oleispira sp.]|nr:hemagglutinin repeat-containing protein [Oleispira sp.]